MFGEGPGGFGEAFQCVAVGVGIGRELAADLIAQAVEFRAEFGDQVGFAGLEFVVELRAPALEPGVEVVLHAQPGVLRDLAAFAGDVLDPPGEALDFLALLLIPLVEVAAEGVELARVFGVGMRGVDGHRADLALEARETLLDRLHLAADQDFADALDLTGRGVFGGWLWHGGMRTRGVNVRNASGNAGAGKDEDASFARDDGQGGRNKNLRPAGFPDSVKDTAADPCYQVSNVRRGTGKG